MNRSGSKIIVRLMYMHVYSYFEVHSQGNCADPFSPEMWITGLWLFFLLLCCDSHPQLAPNLSSLLARVCKFVDATA